MISVKQGVDLRGIQPVMALAAMIAEQVYRSELRDLVITSACDGKHMQGSLHASGRALDLRTTAAGIDEARAKVIASKLRGALGAQFDVVLESDHIHVEFDPKEAKG